MPRARSPSSYRADRDLERSVGQVRLDLAETQETLNEHIAAENPHGTMKWRGDWDGGSYLKDDVVKDGDFTMIALVDTDDRPAPQTVGPPTSAPSPDPTFANLQASVGLLGTGQRFTPSQTSLILAIRAYIPVISPTREYFIYSVNRTTGDDSTTPIQPITTGWQDVISGGVIIQAGDEYEVVLYAQETGSTTTFTRPWVYDRANQDQVPATGVAFKRGNRSYIRFNKTDDDGGDASADLASVIPGSIITVTGSTYNLDVLGTTDAATYVEFEVAESGAIPAQVRQDWKFDIPTPAPIDYVEEAGFYGGDPNIQGVVYEDGVLQPLNDNAYGVGLTSQPVEASPDWDLVAYSDTGALVRSARIAKTAIIEIDADYDAVGSDEVIVADASGGDVTVTLPQAVPIGKEYTVKKSDATANEVIVVDGSTSPLTIDAAASANIGNQYDGIQLIKGSSGWWIK